MGLFAAVPSSFSAGLPTVRHPEKRQAELAAVPVMFVTPERRARQCILGRGSRRPAPSRCKCGTSAKVQAHNPSLSCRRNFFGRHSERVTSCSCCVARNCTKAHIASVDFPLVQPSPASVVLRFPAYPNRPISMGHHTSRRIDEREDCLGRRLHNAQYPRFRFPTAVGATPPKRSKAVPAVVCVAGDPVG